MSARSNQRLSDIRQARLDALKVIIAHWEAFKPFMSAADLKAALSHIPGIESLTITPYGPMQIVRIGDKSATVSQNASPGEIERALTAAPIRLVPREQAKSMTTIGEQLKAARASIAAARTAASEAVSESADATRVVLQEVDKAKKEAADLRAEVAILTNGGPA